MEGPEGLGLLLLQIPGRESGRQSQKLWSLLVFQSGIDRYFLTCQLFGVWAQEHLFLLEEHPCGSTVLKQKFMVQEK